MTRHRRLATVQAVEADESITGAAKRYGMSTSVLSRNLGHYRQHGQQVYPGENTTGQPSRSTK